MQQILVIGFGSIGKRHVANLLEFGKYKISVVSRKALSPADSKTLQVFSSIDEAYENDVFDAVIICTPTAQHMIDLQSVWGFGARNIYIEKPISNNYTGVDVFSEKIYAEKSHVIVGYDMHFDHGFMKVKELVEQAIIGKVLSANATVGQYLPDWRQHENYKEGMSASVEKGGGVLLDLIHEIDYLYCLLGIPALITAQKINSGSLEIETEELAEILVK
ncbi:MAG: Gfo/Idh/MocA family oxidoreductase, partial [Chitinophagaceae bacterium]